MTNASARRAVITLALAAGTALAGPAAAAHASTITPIEEPGTGKPGIVAVSETSSNITPIDQPGTSKPA